MFLMGSYDDRGKERERKGKKRSEKNFFVRKFWLPIIYAVCQPKKSKNWGWKLVERTKKSSAVYMGTKWDMSERSHVIFRVIEESINKGLRNHGNWPMGEAEVSRREVQQQGVLLWSAM